MTLAFSPHVFGQGKNDVAVHLTTKKVVTAEGESLESAEKAKPGDLIQYEAVYQNTSKAPVKNLQALVPAPRGLAFVAHKRMAMSTFLISRLCASDTPTRKSIISSDSFRPLTGISTA